LFRLSPNNFEYTANVVLDYEWFSSRELIKELLSHLLIVGGSQLNRMDTLVSVSCVIGRSGRRSPGPQ
jgi:hypothetical protein